MTPEPVSYSNPLQDEREPGKGNHDNQLFLTKQVTAVHVNQQPQADNGLAPTQESSQSITTTMAKQQEMYNDLIGQVSKELQDIQTIKQNLVSMTNQMNDQKAQMMQSMQA